MAVGGLALFVVSVLLDKPRSRWESLGVVAQPAE
jgi:hypothetical protein